MCRGHTPAQIKSVRDGPDHKHKCDVTVKTVVVKVKPSS